MTDGASERGGRLLKDSACCFQAPPDILAPMLTHAGPLVVLPFDPSRLGLFALPLQGNTVTPVAPSSVLGLANAEAALNGPMFGVCSGQHLPRGNAQYAVSQCDTLSYTHYDASAGLDANAAHDTRGITISVVNGQAQSARGDSYSPDASVAVQLYPSLIESGQITASSDVNKDRVWRSGLAILNNGQLLFAVGQMPMVDFAQALAGLGAVHAGYTDGGGSSALVAPGESAWSTENRPVASWLIVKKSGLGDLFGSGSAPVTWAKSHPRAILWGGLALSVSLFWLALRGSTRR